MAAFKITRISLVLVAALIVPVPGYLLYMVTIANPRVAQELIDQPDGERAKRVMLLTLPDMGQFCPYSSSALQNVFYRILPKM